MNKAFYGAGMFDKCGAFVKHVKQAYCPYSYNWSLFSTLNVFVRDSQWCLDG
jgi:hypothetical protein